MTLYTLSDSDFEKGCNDFIYTHCPILILRRDVMTLYTLPDSDLEKGCNDFIHTVRF